MADFRANPDGNYGPPQGMQMNAGSNAPMDQPLPPTAPTAPTGPMGPMGSSGPPVSYSAPSPYPPSGPYSPPPQYGAPAPQYGPP